MKNSGFASIYSLLLLEIVVAFALMLITAATSLSASDPQSVHYEAELFAIYHIKAQIKDMDNSQPSENEDITVNDEKGTPGEDEFIIPYENLSYEGITIEFYYERDHVDVYYQDVHLCIYFDPAYKRITDLVYLSQ